MHTKKTYLTIISVFLLLSAVLAQNDRIQVLEAELKVFAKNNKNINQTVDITMAGTIQEITTAIAESSELNVVVSPQIKVKLASNFSKVKPYDLLLYLCREYNLTLEFSGSIISIKPYNSPKLPPRIDTLKITYNGYNRFLTMDVKNDTLASVLKKITQLTSQNIVPSPTIRYQQVSSFIKDVEFENAMEQFARANNLILGKNDKGYYTLISVLKNAANTNNTNNRNTRNNGRQNNRKNKGNDPIENLDVKLIQDSTGSFVGIQAENVDIKDVIKEVSWKLKENYYLFVEPVGKITLQLDKVTYREFLGQILQTSVYSYQVQNEIYLIGERKAEGQRTTEVYQLKERSAKEIETFIPAAIQQNVEIKPFLELNALVLSGSVSNIEEVKTFLKEIDRPVPVVKIELIILDVQNNRETNLGVSAGLGTEPTQAGGSIYPNVDFTFGTNAINDILALISGSGAINLGQVKPNFYLSLQAVEDQGHIKVRSKPKLATLNGKEATFTLGEKRFYQIQEVSYPGSDRPIPIQSQRFESAEANFSIKINPMVSANEQVTLDIEVEQTEFVGQPQLNSPPPSVTRKFQSTIRIKNGEMIVLGGLESKTVENSGQGVPLLSRIPVIKWFFSKRKSAKKKTKLLIFVKPTVVY